MSKSSKLFVGMDVHKDSIDLATGEERGEVRHHGAIGGDLAALGRAVRKLQSLGKALVFVYEAGPCCFVIYRFLRARARVLGGRALDDPAPEFGPGQDRPARLPEAHAPGARGRTHPDLRARCGR